MAVAFNGESGGFVIIPDNCPDCGEPLYDTGCDAPDCSGRACVDCGIGCDIDFADDGRCARALAAETEEDREERFDQERAAWGLPPAGGGA